VTRRGQIRRHLLPAPKPKPPNILESAVKQTISDIALARSDHDAARKRYEEALEILLFSYVLGRKMMRQVLIKTAEEKRGRMKGFSAESLMEKRVVHQLR
jgi:hypothetical protein